MSKYYLFRIIIGALITVFIVLDFHFMNNPDPLKSIDKIRDYVHDIPLQLDFNEDSGYEFINSKAYTFVGVDIRQLDSLIWWKEMELKWQRKDLDYLEFTQFNDDSTLQTNYTIAFCNSQNNKLLSEFLGKAGSSYNFELSNDPTQFTFTPFDGQEEYYFKTAERRIPKLLKAVRDLTYFFGYLLFTFFVYNAFRYQPDLSNLLKAAIIMVSVRSAGMMISIHIYKLRLPTGFQPHPEISPFNYPADLLLNTVCLFLIISLFCKIKFNLKPSPSETGNFLKTSALYACLVAISTGVIWYFKWVVFNSEKFLDLNYLFDTSIYGISRIVSIIFIVLSAFILHYHVYKLIYQIESRFAYRIAGFGLSIILLGPLIFNLGLNIPVVYIITGFIIYIALFDVFLDTRRLSVAWLIWWMIIHSCFIALLLFAFINQKQSFEILEGLKSMTHKPNPVIIDKLIQDRAELIEIDIGSFVNEKFPFQFNKRDLWDYLQSKNIRTQDFENTYGIHLVDNSGSSLIEYSDAEFENFKIDYFSLSETSHKDIHYNPFTNIYYLSFEIRNQKYPENPFTLLLEYHSDTVYARFDSRSFSPFLSQYPIALYRNDSLVYSNSNDFIEKIDPVSSSEMIRIVNGEKWVYLSLSDKTTIVAKYQLADLIKPISLFSYIFSLTGILFVFLAIANYYYEVIPLEFNFVFTRASLRNRIQISVVALILFAFIIIGIVTIYYFFRLSTNYKKQSLVYKLNTVGNNLKSEETNYHLMDSLSASELRDKISNLSFSLQSDLILYDRNGESVGESLDFSSENRRLHIPYKAFEFLRTDPSVIYFGETLIGRGKDQKVLSAIAAIKSSRGSNLGYLQILDSGNNNSGFNVSDYMGTLLNVYVFLFLIAGTIAIAVANSITYPIAVLGDKLRKFKLGRQNEPLEWKGRDELGALISEYNRLIIKLDESAHLIAKTERDSAWREMAKQVAHEIKNPLTPMKLSIQYLEKAIHRNPAESEKLIDRVSSTLIEQIDNLTQIANEFSNFAKLPQAQNEKVVLNEVVEAIHDLFRKREDMDIILQVPIDDILVFADRNHLIRILNNIVKNAIQAIPNDRRGKVELNLYKDKNSAIIKISDNGIGIPENMRDKVFSPNFTTKSSGTGLGLAISANMLESFNGTIQFETEEGEGTKFYVNIPLMKLKDNYQQANRVVLE